MAPRRLAAREALGLPLLDEVGDAQPRRLAR